MLDNSLNAKLLQLTIKGILILNLSLFSPYIAFSLSPVSDTRRKTEFIEQLISKKTVREIKSILSNDEGEHFKEIKDLIKKYPHIDVYEKDFLQIGNVIGLMEIKPSLSGKIIIWGNTSTLKNNESFIRVKKSIPELEKIEQQQFENLLNALNIKFIKDSTGTFYYIENSEELNHLKEIYKLFISFTKNLYTGGMDAFKKDATLLQKISNKIKSISPSLDSNSINHILWYYVSEQLRFWITKNKIPLAIKEDEKVLKTLENPTMHNTTLNLYFRITENFLIMSQLIKHKQSGDKTDRDTSIYGLPAHQLLRYSTLMSDWLSKTQTSDWINTIINKNMYFNYLLETLLYKFIFRDELDNFRPFDKENNNYHKTYEKDQKKFLSPKGYDSMASCIQSIKWIDKFSKMLGKHALFVMNQAYQFDIHAQKELLSHLNEEIEFMLSALNRSENIVKKLQRSKKVKKITPDQVNEFNNAHAPIKSLLENLQKHIILFRTGLIDNENFNIDFPEIIKSGTISNLFHIARLFAPDNTQSVYLKGKEYQEAYNNIIKEKMTSFFSQMNQLPENELPDETSNLSFLSPVDPRFFRQFAFWDKNWPVNLQKDNLEFLKQALKSENKIDAQFSSLILAYHNIIKALSSGKNHNDLFNKAYKFFKFSFSNIDKVVTQRKKTLGKDDYGYYSNSISESITPLFQEVNRMINFITHLLFDNDGNILNPTTAVHKIHPLEVASEEESILNAVQSDELIKANKQDINWNIVTAITKYNLSLLAIQVPPIRKVEKDFLILIESSVPDKNLYNLLNSFFLDDHWHSLIYADFLKKYFDDKKTIKSRYPESIKIIDDFLANRESKKWQYLACYSQSLFEQKRYKEAIQTFDLMLNNNPTYIDLSSKSDLAQIPDIIFNSPLTQPLHDNIRKLEKLETKIREKAANVTIAWVNNGTGDTNQLKQLLSAIYSSDKILNLIEWENNDEKKAVIGILKDNQHTFKTSYELITLLINKFDFHYKQPKNQSGFSGLTDFWNSKYENLNFLISTARELATIMKAKDKESSQDDPALQGVIDNLTGYEETKSFLENISKLNQAVEIDENFILAEEYLNTILKITRINLAENKNNTLKRKKGWKKKKGKKKKKSPNQKVSSFFSTFPPLVQNLTTAYLASIDKQLKIKTHEQHEIRKSLKIIVKGIYSNQTANIPMKDVEETITTVESISKQFPNILTTNLFQEDKDPSLYSYASQFIDRKNSKCKLLQELQTIRSKTELTANATISSFDRLLKDSTNDKLLLKGFLKQMENLQTDDTKKFKETLILINNKLRLNLDNLLPHLTKLMTATGDDFSEDHFLLSRTHFLQISQIQFISNGILKLIYKNQKSLQTVSNAEKDSLININSLAHKCEVTHILKLLRLKLSVLDEVEEIKYEEAKHAFIVPSEDREYTERPEIDFKNPERIIMKLESLKTFLPDAKENNKLKKAKRIFELGDRVMFFTTRKEYFEQMKEHPLPKFEIHEISKDDEEKGQIILRLLNKSDFSEDIKLSTIIDKYIPQPTVKKPAYLYIRKTFSIRNRLMMMNKIVEEITSKFKSLTDPISSIDSVVLSDSITNYKLLNTILGLIPKHQKATVEIKAHENTDITNAPASLNKAQASIAVQLQNSSDSKDQASRLHNIRAAGGVGKTYFLVEIIKALTKHKSSHMVVAPTHKAVANAALSLLKKGLKATLIRIGSEDASKKMDPLIKKELWDNRSKALANPTKSKIVFGSSTGFQGDSELNYYLREKLLNLKQMNFDYIFYDEAGMDPLDELLYLITEAANENTIVVLLGDILQLSSYGLGTDDIKRIAKYLPVKRRKNFNGINISKDLLSPWALDLLTTSPLELFHGQFGYKSHYLKDNYRSSEEIVTLLNEIAYSEHDQTMISKKPSLIPPYKQVIFLGNNIKTSYPDDEWIKNADGTKEKNQYINKLEISLILKQMEKDFRDVSDLTGDQVTFISPYKAQNRLFSSSLMAYAFLGELQNIMHTSSKEINFPQIPLSEITSKVNELITIYGKVKTPINFEEFNNAEFSTIELSNKAIEKLYLSLKERLPDFIPLSNINLTLSKITNFNMIDISSKDMDITTIQKVQGRENRAVYVSLVRKNKTGNLGFFLGKKGPGMIITAFGRAQEMLRVAADENTWRRALSFTARNKIQDYRYSFGKKAAAMVIGMITFSKNLENKKPRSKLDKQIEKDLPQKKAA